MRRISARGLRALGLLLAAAVLVLAAACSGDDEDSEGSGRTDAADTTAVPPADPDVRLTLIATTSPQEPFERLAALFSQTPEGDGVLVEQSYGNAFQQTQQLGFGLPADLFAPGSEADLLGLVEAGQIRRDWDDDEFGGMITNSVVAFVVRSGNPKRIRGWADLARDGVRVVMGDPNFSSVARWASLAAYGAQLEQGRTPAQARRYLEQLFANVTVEGTSARETFTAFSRGSADVLLTSEAEALTAQKKGSALDHVVPDETILIESPIALTTSAQPEARAFLDYLRTEGSQRIFGEEGHRPVLESARAAFDFPDPPGLFTIERFGGWRNAHLDFFTTFGTVMSILRNLGKISE
jgi:ABC-type sulfate transport system substrate-binding protein